MCFPVQAVAGLGCRDSMWVWENQLGHTSAEEGFLLFLHCLVGTLYCYLNYSVFCYVLEVVCSWAVLPWGLPAFCFLGLAPQLFQAWWSGGGNIPGRCFPHLVIVFLS